MKIYNLWGQTTRCLNKPPFYERGPDLLFGSFKTREAAEKKLEICPQGSSEPSPPDKYGVTIYYKTSYYITEEDLRE